MSRFANEYRAAQYARKEADKQARIAAFGAIRRAAELARHCDALSRTQASSHWGIRAHAMRAAIRAAVESPKA